MPRIARVESIVDATRSYETWVARQVPTVPADLVFKHEQMALAPLAFLRATFYRWMQVWPSTCREVATAPRVLSVGDLHTENFGTWRDREGRLVWGINDFDEAFPLAYTNDLVRLATSARLAIAAKTLVLTPRSACAAILDGYRASLRSGGRPFVLAEENPVLLAEAESELRNPVHFWARMLALPSVRRPLPAAIALLRAALGDAQGPRFVTRRAGLGSLGHQRIIGLAERDGGRIAREAKTLVASAAAWASGGSEVPPIRYVTIVRHAVRCPDPFLEVHGDWVVRRLAPDCSRIEFTQARTAAEQKELLRAMGAETANVHLGSGATRVASVWRDVAKRDPDWLRVASKTMERATLADHDAWRSRRSPVRATRAGAPAASGPRR